MTETLEATPRRELPEPLVLKRRTWPTVVGVVVAALGLLAAASSATVTVTVPVESVEASVEVPAPVSPLRAEKSHGFEVPIVGHTEAARATGTVEFDYDEEPFAFRTCHEMDTCAPSEIAVAAGTRVATCADVLSPSPCTRFDVVFETTEPFRIKRSDFSKRVPVRAVEPGTRGNVKYGMIDEVVLNPPSIPNAVLRVLFSSEMTGGADERRGVVGQADVDRVVAAEGPRLRAEAERRLRKAAGKEGLAPAADLRVEVRADARPPVGTPSPTAEVTVTAVATATGFPEDDLRREATRALEAARPPGRFLVPDSVGWDPPVVEGERVRATARAWISPVDTEAVSRDLRGRRPGPAERDLEARYGTGSVAVKRPLPLPVLPFFASRIDVEVRAP